MKIIVFLAISFLFCCSGPSDKHNEVKKFIFDSAPRQRFTISYHLDSLGIEECVYNMRVRKSVHFFFENMIGKIDSAPTGMIIKTPEFRLGVCNLPDQLKSYSDSVLISGRIFHSLGDERMRGRPTILSDIRTKRR